MWVDGMLLCDVLAMDKWVPLPGSKLALRIAVLETKDDNADIHPAPDQAFPVLDALTHMTPWREMYVRERGRLDAMRYMEKRYGLPALPVPSPADSPASLSRPTSSAYLDVEVPDDLAVHTPHAHGPMTRQGAGLKDVKGLGLRAAYQGTL